MVRTCVAAAGVPTNGPHRQPLPWSGECACCRAAADVVPRGAERCGEEIPHAKVVAQVEWPDIFWVVRYYAGNCGYTDLPLVEERGWYY